MLWAKASAKVEQRLRPGLPYADGNDRRVIVEQGDGMGATSSSVSPISSASSVEQVKPTRAPLLARSYCPAPRFCPVKVVSAMAKEVMGRNTKPSTLA